MGYFNGNKVGSVIRPPKSLVAKTLVLSNIGWHMAYDEGVEGFSAVYCEPPVLPSSAKDFITGNDNIVTLFLETDISEVKGCFQCFPNLTTLIVSNASSVVIFPSNMLDGTSINKIVVPQPLYNQYVTRYPQYADYGDSHINLFDYWTASVDYTLPFIGETTLTAEYVEQVASILGAQASIVTHLTIPNDFTDYDGGSLSSCFSAFTSLSQITSPWLNGLKASSLVLTIPSRGLSSLSSEYLLSVLSSDRAVSEIIVGLDTSEFNSSRIANGAISISNYSNIKTVIFKYDGNVSSDKFDTDSVAEEIVIKATTQIMWGYYHGNRCQFTKSGIKKVRTDTTQMMNVIYYYGTAFSTTIEELDFSNSGGWVASNSGRMFYNNHSGAVSMKKMKLGDISRFELTEDWFSESFPNLTDIQIDNIQKNCNIAMFPSASVDSLAYIVGQLYDYSGGTQHTLKVGSSNIGKFTPELLAQASAKNWNVVAQ